MPITQLMSFFKEILILIYVENPFFELFCNLQPWFF